jgi:hypothetical protein
MASIADIKARLANLNKKTTKNADIWKPKDEHDVRLLKNPYSDDPFIERAFHYNIGDAREILCPKVNFGDECVICDFADTLRAWKDEKGRDKPEKERKADFEIFKKIQVVSKVVVPVVERQKGADGKTTQEISAPGWWPLTANQAQQVLKVCTDADRLAECGIEPGDDERAFDALFGTKKAFDLHVSFKKPGEKGNNKSFTMVEIEPKFKATPLTGNAAKDAEVIGGIKPIDEVYPKVPGTEVAAALKKFIGGGMQVEQVQAKPGGEKYAAKTKENAAKAGTRSVDDSFGELLDETAAK